VRAHFLLPLASLVLGVPCLAAASGGGLHVRTSLDEEQPTSIAPPSPRRVRSSLDDDAAAIAPVASIEPPHPLSLPVRLSAAPRRLFRLTLDSEPPPPNSRLIRLSLEDGSVYGRLNGSGSHGRYVRTSLD
jgi:hypothetical protein